MNKQLKKAISLSQKTGDRLIVVDSSGQNDPFVIMPIDQYEHLLGQEEVIHELTDEQLLDKINRDIATWKARKEEVREAVKMPVFEDDLEFERDEWWQDDDIEDDDVVDDYTGKFDKYQYAPEIEMKDDFESIKEAVQEKRGRKSHWQIPSDRKEAAEEVIEEDRQYLEDVPF